MAGNIDRQVAQFRARMNKIIPDIESSIPKALKLTGETVRRTAVANIAAAGIKGSKQLRTSVNYEVMQNGNDHYVRIGTNVAHGVYVEFGTGMYAVGPMGSRAKKIPWHYKDDGGWHTTRGVRPRPWLGPAYRTYAVAFRPFIKKVFADVIKAWSKGVTVE